MLTFACWYDALGKFLKSSWQLEFEFLKKGMEECEVQSVDQICDVNSIANKPIDFLVEPIDPLGELVGFPATTTLRSKFPKFSAAHFFDFQPKLIGEEELKLFDTEQKEEPPFELFVDNDIFDPKEDAAVLTIDDSSSGENVEDNTKKIGKQVDSKVPKKRYKLPKKKPPRNTAQ